MKINRVADEMLVPSWTFQNKSLDEHQQQLAKRNDIERLNATAADKVNEDTLMRECEEIEKCSSSGKTYYYNNQWQETHVSHLKEFASACGLNKKNIQGIDPKILINDMNDLDKKAESTQIIKTAASNLVLEDPFHIDKRTDMSYMEKQDWQTITKQSELKDKPSMIGSVIPVRGGEDYLKNSDPKLAINQNTISNPNIIKTLSENSIEDNGQRLKRERIERETNKKTNATEWEKGIIDAMTKKDIVPHGRVFPTEVMNAQSGLQNPSSKMGVYAKFNKDDIPEMTEGEKIKESRNKWNNSIKREAKDKMDFTLDKATERTISDFFSEELKKNLNKGTK